MGTGTTFFLIKDQNGGYHKINYADLLFVKSAGNYLQFVTEKSAITTLGSLQSLQDILEKDKRYMRIHRSYIVNLDHVDHISPEGLTVGKTTLPIGSKFLAGLKSEFIQMHLLKLS